MSSSIRIDYRLLSVNADKTKINQKVKLKSSQDDFEIVGIIGNCL